VGNSQDVDYYYVNTQDTRATSVNGLRIGGDGQNDIWSLGPYGGEAGGCCGGNIASLSAAAVQNQGRAFGYGYNWDGAAPSETALFTGRYLAGRYGQTSGMTYEELVNEVNMGTQSRVGVRISGAIGAGTGTGNAVAICLDSDEVYYAGSGTILPSNALVGKSSVQIAAASYTATGIASAINNNANSKYWAMQSAGVMYVFRKDGGDNDHLAIETIGTLAADVSRVKFINPENGAVTSGIGSFSMGGEHWGTMVAAEQAAGGYSLALLGRDIGDGMDLYITGGTGAADTALSAALVGVTNKNIAALGRGSFAEIQDASDAPWAGAEIRTMESAARALEAVDDAITRKDQIRASLGAMQSRLESVMETQTIHMENLQAAESRISDVDVATEMTEFTRSNILAQAATAMLAQANSMSNLALSLILG
jgi:flagellin